jgi:hypothetical protein
MRVKSYEDACKVLGIEPIVDEVLQKLGFTKDEIAYRKLKTVAEALNEGWEPDWENTDEYKYCPWFRYNGAVAGFVYAHANSVPSWANTYVGSRLCFKSSNLATFAGKQFIDLYNELILIK